MNAAEIIERAADIMQERGKCEGSRESGGRVCAIGALAIVCGGSAWTDAHELPNTVRDSLTDFVGTHELGKWWGIGTWSNTNDAPTVIAGLRAVAATLRAQQAAPVAERVPA